MELKLQVDGHQLSNEVTELLSKLTDQQKAELAKQMLAESFAQFGHQLDHTYVEQKALEEVRLSRKDPDMSLGKAKDSWEWRGAMEKHRSLRSQIVTAVVDTTIAETKKQVAAIVAADGVVKKVIAESIIEVQQNFPT